MKKMSLQTYLLSIFAILIIATGLTMRVQLNQGLSHIHQTHIDEVATLYSEMVRGSYQEIDTSLTAVLQILQSQTTNTQAPTSISQLSPTATTILHGAFQNLPFLTSMTLKHQNQALLRVEYDAVSKTLLETTPPQASNLIPVARQTENWTSYALEDGKLYLESPLEKFSNYQLMVQISPRRLFDKVIGFLEQRADVGFYLIDNSNHINLAAYHKSKLIDPEIIANLYQQRPEFIELERTSYKVHFYEMPNDQVTLLTIVPVNTVIGAFVPIANKVSIQLVLSLLTLFGFIYGITYYMSQHVNVLSNISKRITDFDFSAKHYPESFVAETDQLGKSIKQLEATIQNMLDLIVDVSAAEGLKQLHQTLTRAVQPRFIDKVTLFYIYEELCINAETGEEHLLEEVVNYPTSTENQDHSTTQKFKLQDEKGKLIGVLFLRSNSAQPLSSEQHSFILRLSKLIAISLSKYQLLKQQKELLSAFTQTIATAIDAKSPHTGGHCQRVPELTMAMVDAAQNDQQAFSDFQLSSEQLEEVRLAAWLHDCGKLTTKDHVIDKSTKLDQFGNRIHEVRTRFEVLKRDVQIAALCSQLSPQQLNQVEAQWKQTWQQLDQEFAFIAKLNLGETAVEQSDLERLTQIAKRSFVRTLDASIGLSWEESQRLTENDKQVGVTESLLADKPNHIVPWSQPPIKEERFSLEAPEHQYNFGEIYNLSIARGTLSSEERFLINDHIIQTIKLLEKLPYPDYLSAVPMIAGGHHEQMSGKGYPMSIEAEHLPTSARMLAIADIFEALTAKDRPYKTPKSLSQALTILANMAKSQHIDKALLTLFIEKEVYLPYAHKHLTNEQIDNVDAQALVNIYN